MAHLENQVMSRLLILQQKTGCNIVQKNGQRRFGPPHDWTGPPPPRGCEVFIGKLPRQIFEDELVPIFSKVGKIYDMRLMMDYSGSNRGFAFVMYTNRDGAVAAINELNGLEIRPGRYITVAKSVDNSRLFLGGIPEDKTKLDVFVEISNIVKGVVDVTLNKNCFDRRRNRGFAFVEFVSHRAASLARGTLWPSVRLWGQHVTTDWAEPEPHVDDDLMKQVKVLFVRNFFIGTSPRTIQFLFESAIKTEVERVRKFYDYAFIHFFEREHAELAMAKLQNVEVDGNKIEIRLAKPVDQELYRMQKVVKGNAKFNRNMDLTQTLLLYKQHLAEKEFEEAWESGELGSQGAAAALNYEPQNNRVMDTNYLAAPAKLAAICNIYGWTLPIYTYRQLIDHFGNEIWIGHVELPYVGLPLLCMPHTLGPLETQPCSSTSQAQVEAAKMILKCIEEQYEMIPSAGELFRQLDYFAAIPHPHSEWSVEWSTVNIPGMDNAAGSARHRRERGRRRLRFASLSLASCLTMHCRVVEPAITSGLLYYPFLIAAVAGLANPLRHFEVYLGQWSINGPGRAFRILPMLDGIGIAMCIGALVRAINCCTMAAIALLYVVYSSSDSRLPSTHCRDWDLKAYEPVARNVTFTVMNARRQRRLNPEVALKLKKCFENEKNCAYTPAFMRTWRDSLHFSEKGMTNIRQCNEVYHGYPLLYSPPAYNYFYVELVMLRPNYDFLTFNVPLLICLACIWVFIWLLMVGESITYGRLVWNSLYPWISYVPWVWVACLAVVAVSSVSAPSKIVKQLFTLGGKEIFFGMLDAFVVALYIHSASMGTELIHGKGLNFYAMGHIDPLLNYDNVWHSCLVLALAVLHSFCTTICALGDVPHPDLAAYYNTRESSMWIMPLYSKCTSRGNYSHAMSCIIFGGLSFSYIVVAYPLIKSSLHTIFEYRVKLVFIEQHIVAALICSCMLLSVPYATGGGLALLESVDSLMTGVAMPIVVVAELVALLYVYRSHDFQSDINVATEDNTCNSRISTSWQIIPIVTAVVVIGKIISVSNAEMPTLSVCAAVAPLLATVLALPLRAAHNAVAFMHPAPRRGV